MTVSETNIQIKHDFSTKPYFGGFKHRVSNLVYHHASCQTIALQNDKEKMPDLSHLRCRETQTATLVTRSCQSHSEVGIQVAPMNDQNTFSLGVTDKEIIARSTYMTSDKLLEQKKKLALLLQERWRYQKSVTEESRIRLPRNNVEQNDKIVGSLDLEENVAKISIKRGRLEIDGNIPAQKLVAQSRIQLKISKKFGSTKNLEQSEQSAQTFKEHKLFEMELKSKEVRALQSIGNLKSKQRRSKRIELMLHQMSQPKRWELSDGKIVEVYTPAVKQAAKMKTLHDELRNESFSDDDRLNTLLKVKQTVQEFEECILTRDICDLVDREADMVNRGRNEKSLSGMRMRLRNLFVQFFMTPDFNPESRHFNFI
eukprot:CAMPEP_0194376214 /NCGR_PEP_ID=MMETSP0174-20130528/24667_1 /TAXON_ID=216777 /ORGANISM="Proboscia alata, Strain PI-D3" /LENGTH=369 /DNA_ID=CAMNT_0039156791 /DNA_START=221 /DNA_END=1330 /DNA_ORIENTATION=+